MKKTKLIRVSDNFAYWLDNDVNKFLKRFENDNHRRDRIPRPKAADKLMEIFKNSDIYFPDNFFNREKKKRRFEFEYKGGKFNNNDKKRNY